MSRGVLRIYLGAAAGVGKTYAMLDEGHRRATRGTDVVVGAIDAHGRPATAAQLAGLANLCEPTSEDLQTIPLRLTELIERNPDVVLVDEMARTDLVDGSPVPRHRSIERLLSAGIDVLTTIDIGQLESLGEVVEQITGVPSGLLVPDTVVRDADQIHLVDQTPEALRRRLAHGNIFSAQELDAELAHAYRPESLAELRALTLSWMSNRVEDRVEQLRRTANEERGWETREVVVVALTGAPSSENVIRRAARLAERQRAHLVGFHVRSIDAVPPSAASATLEDQRRLVAALGGEYREVAAGDVAGALVEFAQARGATQLVVGAPRRSRWMSLTRGSLISDVLERSPIDVHVVSAADPTTGGAGAPRTPLAALMPGRRSAPFSGRRIAWGWFIGATVPVALAALLTSLHPSIGLSAQLLAMVLGVTLTAMIGGAPPAMLAAVEAFLLSNWFFIPPVHQLSISSSEDAVSLLVFLVVAIALGTYVSVSATRSAESLLARSDASTLAAMAGAVASFEDPLPEILDRLRVVHAAESATLLVDDGSGWSTVASSGAHPPTSATDADRVLNAGPRCRLLLSGGPFRVVDRSTSVAFLDQLAVAVEQRLLRAGRARAETMEAANELRAALLAAVSHDLRTPLASVKAAVSSLRQPGLDWPEDVEEELLATIEQGADRLNALISNLLDMSRIQAGAVDLHIDEVSLDEVVHRAAMALGPRPVPVDIELDDRLPSVIADAALLGHVVGNIMDNAIKWSPADGTVIVDASEVDHSVHLRVIDRGPGIPPELRQVVRQPFQRHDDSASIEGTGLGLAVADGLGRLMGIDLIFDDTPGGGTTATLVIPLSGPRRA